MDDFERREHVRIDDHLYFDFQVIFPEDHANDSLSQHLSASDDQKYLEATQYFQQIDVDLNELSQTIAHKDPTIAHYLNLLNAKINFLSRKIMIKDEVELRQVNLSLGGMAFQTNKSLKMHSPLKAVIYTKTKMIPVLVNAIVVHCDPMDDGFFRIAIEFQDLSDDDEQVLAQHMMLAKISQRE